MDVEEAVDAIRVQLVQVDGCQERSGARWAALVLRRQHARLIVIALLIRHVKLPLVKLIRVRNLPVDGQANSLRFSIEYALFHEQLHSLLLILLVHVLESFEHLVSFLCRHAFNSIKRRLFAIKMAWARSLGAFPR